MKKVILVFANCRNSKARGDYALAVSIAKDLAVKLNEQSSEIQIVLTSTAERIKSYENFLPIHVMTNGVKQKITVTPIESIDITSQLLAYIDVNQCKIPPVHLIRRILQPESKMLYVGAPNRPLPCKCYLKRYDQQQPGIFSFIQSQNIGFFSSGLGEKRIGLPQFNILEKIESPAQPTYGFMYLNSAGNHNQSVIAQYLEITTYQQYVLVGDFKKYQQQIQKLTIKPIQLIPFLSAEEMQKQMRLSGKMVLSTGVMSTLEAWQAGKLCFYQYFSQNEYFVKSYLNYIKPLCEESQIISSLQIKMIIQLSELLMKRKPLFIEDRKNLQSLLTKDEVTGKLVEFNQNLIKQHNGKIASHLLSFINKPSNKNIKKTQLENILSEFKNPQSGALPSIARAIRMAACLNKPLALKILFAHMEKSDIDKPEQPHHLTALHLAVLRNHTDCVKLLIQADCELFPQDKHGQTPLDYSISNENAEMSYILTNALLSRNNAMAGPSRLIKS